MTDDEPLDLAQVAADDAALEDVHRSGRAANDPVLLLLRDLLDDIGEQETPVPVGCGSTVLTLAGDRGPERRTVRKGALVAALTAGLLSVSGVAAAATLAPSGTPLHGLGEAVRSAVGLAVGSVTPPEPVAPAVPVVPSSPTGVPEQAPPAVAPGADVSAAARSTAAARQVTALLDAAAELLRDGRTAAASARLDVAESRLSDVAAAEAEPLATRLAALRDEVEAAAAAPKTQTEPDAPKQPATQPDPAPRADPAPPPAADPPNREQPAAERQPAGKGTEPRGSSRTSEPGAPSAPALGEVRGQLPGQASKDASTKPRA